MPCQSPQDTHCSNTTYGSITLADLPLGQTAKIERVLPDSFASELLLRLSAMGIVPNKSVCVLRKAWFGGPIHVRIGWTTEVAMRRSEAEKVLVCAPTH